MASTRAYLGPLFFCGGRGNGMDRMWPGHSGSADLELAQIGGAGCSDSKAGTGLGDHGVATLCDH